MFLKIQTTAGWLDENKYLTANDIIVYVNLSEIKHIEVNEDRGVIYLYNGNVFHCIQVLREEEITKEDCFEERCELELKVSQNEMANILKRIDEL